MSSSKIKSTTEVTKLANVKPRSPSVKRKRNNKSGDTQLEKQAKITSCKGFENQGGKESKDKDSMEQADPTEESTARMENVSDHEGQVAAKIEDTSTNEITIDTQDLKKSMSLILIKLEEVTAKQSSAQTALDDMSIKFKITDNKIEAIQKRAISNSGKLDSINDKVDESCKKISDTNTFLNEIKRSLEHTQAEVDDIKIDLTTVKKKVVALENKDQTNTATLQQVLSENKQLHSRMEYLENYSRRENVIIDGLHEPQHENPLDAANYVFQSLKMSTPQIQRCHRLGRRVDGRSRPLIIRLTLYPDKLQMFKNARHLRGTNLILRDDLCKETLQKQAQLRPVLAVAKRHDQKAKFVNDKILFRGSLYGKESLHKFPIDLQQASCKRGNGVTIFSGELCPLSNLYPCEITIDNKTYASTEHYYQSKKCESMGKADVAKTILRTPTPRQAMFMGKETQPPIDWYYSKGKEIMAEALRAKFENETLRDYLLSTIGILGEATRGKIWGIGYNIHESSAAHLNEWSGSNLMGDLLTTLRDEIASSLNTNA